MMDSEFDLSNVVPHPMALNDLNFAHRQGFMARGDGLHDNPYQKDQLAYWAWEVGNKSDD